MNPRESLAEQAGTLADLKATALMMLKAESSLPSEKEAAARIVWLAGKAERQREESLRRLAGYYPLEIRGQRVDGTTYRAIW